MDSIIGVLLLILVGHVGVLLVALFRALMPQRGHPDRTLCLAAGTAALLGELLALGALIGHQPPLPWVAGTLGIALLLGTLARRTWREHAVGRVAFHAILAAPIVAAFVVALSLR